MIGFKTGGCGVASSIPTPSACSLSPYRATVDHDHPCEINAIERICGERAMRTSHSGMLLFLLTHWMRVKRTKSQARNLISAISWYVEGH